MPKAWSYTFVSYDHGGYAYPLAEQKSGWIRCDQCNDNWCKHIELAVTQREDAETLWQVFDEHLEDGGSHTIYVPISPANKLWATVDIERSTIIPSVMTAYLARPELTSLNLGFFNRGDGRNAIRSVILDWFMALDAYHQCMDGTHGLTAEQNWQRNIKGNSASKWWEYWSTYFHKKCLTCFQRNMNLNFDDLVPDDPKPKYSDGGMVPF